MEAITSMKAQRIGSTHRPPWLSTELFPFQSHYFHYQDSKIHYLDEGNGMPIIFSHPAVGWSFMYRALIQELRPYYRCIAIDYPGFGLSGHPENYVFSLRAQSEVLEALLMHLDLKQCIFLGHDTGGASAFALAAKRPDLVVGLILTDTIIFPVSDYPAIDRFLGIMDTAIFRWINRQSNLLIRITSRFGFRTKKLSQAERQVYLQSFKSKKSRDAVLKILLDLRKDEALMHEVFTAFRDKWQVMPVLLMCGEIDKLVSEGIYDRIKSLMSNVTSFLIPGEEHFPHEGQAPLMAKHIKQWMNSHIVCPISLASSEAD